MMRESIQYALDNHSEALEYAMQLYATFIEGVLSWLDPSNNKAFLADQIGLTANGISIYTVAKNSPDPALKAIAADMNVRRLELSMKGLPRRLY